MARTKQIKYLLLTFCLLFAPKLSSAVGLDDAFSNPDNSNLGVFTKSANIPAQGDLEFYIGNILTALFAILGVISIALLIYSGYIWMTARGNESKVTEAKENISNILIGLIFIIGSYALTTFLLKIFF